MVWYSFSVAFAVELLPPFANVFKVGQEIGENFYFATFLIENVSGDSIKQCGILFDVVFMYAMVAHVAGALHEFFNVVSCHGNRQQSHGCKYGESSADAVGNDIHTVSFLNRNVMQGTFACVGDGYDSFLGLGFSIFVFEMRLDDAESHGGFGGSAGFGDDGQ